MDRFPDGTHVRLRSRVRGAYLCADEDGSGVSLTTRYGTVNAAWQVHRIKDGDKAYIHLSSAAYGRYLALSPCLSPHGHLHGHRGRDAVQRDYLHPQQLNIRWTASTAQDGSRDVLLCNQLNCCYLRANARDGRWKTCACVTVDGGNSTMMYWMVERIPRRPAPPPVPTPTKHDMQLRRKIQYVQAYDDGNFSRSGWKSLWFSGRSVCDLMLVIREKEKISLRITLCVRAGSYGRLTPLVVDLPHSEETVYIIVLTRGSPACQALVYPEVPSLRPLMELFTDGAFLRMKSGGGYLSADEDGVRVWMSPEAMSPKQVWVVQLFKNNNNEKFILLRGAAYGRYLATQPDVDDQGKMLQCSFEEHEQENLLWKVHALEGFSEMRLRSANSDTRFSLCCTAELIPRSPIPPHILLAEGLPEENGKYHTKLSKLTERTIWYKKDDNFNSQRTWSMSVFRGKSLSKLRSLLSDDISSVLCIRAGPYGRWSPLFTDLPDNTDPIEIFVLHTGSRDARALVYPRLEA